MANVIPYQPDSDEDPYRDLRRKARQLLSKWEADGPRLGDREQAELVEELKLSYIELDLQNDELRSSQRDLALARDRYYLYYDLAPVPYLTLSPGGMVVEANLRASELLALPRVRLRQAVHPFTTNLPAAEHNKFYLHLKLVFTKDEPQQVDLHLRRADAPPIPVRLTSRKARREDGSEVCLTFVADLSAERRAPAGPEKADARPELFFGDASVQGLVYLDARLRVVGSEGSGRLAVALASHDLPVAAESVFNDPVVADLRRAAEAWKVDGRAQRLLRPGPDGMACARLSSLPRSRGEDPVLVLVVSDVRAFLR